MPIIVEGLCTTLNNDGTVNIAPMGPIVDRELTSFRFRPFHTSTTFQNLKRSRSGIFHITDDIELIARAAIGAEIPTPEFHAPELVSGAVLADACRWYEFEVLSIDESQARSEMVTRVVHAGHLRDFFGFNRAKHGILELAISATRLHLLAPESVRDQFSYWKTIIEKTGDDAEHRAFTLLNEYVDRILIERD